MAQVTLTEFLLAQIAKDEAVAKSATPGQWERDSGWSVIGPPPEDNWYGPNVVADTKQRDDAEFIAHFNPARVLAECEKNRRLIEDWGRWESYNGDELMQVLALPYADRPGYLPEWNL